MNDQISRQKLIEELTDVIIKHTCKPSGCQDCPCAFEYGIVEESCEEYLEYHKLAEKIYNEFVINITNQQPPADQWIPVTYHEATEEEKEAYGEFPYMLDCKLPDDGEEILVCTKSGCVWTDTFFNDDGCYLDGGYDFAELAAWMPMPEPYKAVE